MSTRTRGASAASASAASASAAPLPAAGAKPKRVNRRVLEAALACPWAITEEGLQVILAIASRRTLFEEAATRALQARDGEPLENAYRVTVRDGVARIPVRGTLTRYASWFSDISGAVSYDRLATDLTAALEDRAVRAIVLDFDSPGGEVNGCAELARLIASYRVDAPVGADGRRPNPGKPIIGYASNLACSAGYWLASACDEVVASPTAVLGCLGVKATYLDRREAERRAGYREVEIVSSQTPNKAPDPATDEGRSQVQRTVDGLAAVFLADVAGYRDVDPASVAERFGAGDVFVGDAGVTAGLADRVSTYEALHAELVTWAAEQDAAPARLPGLPPLSAERRTSHQEPSMPRSRATSRVPAAGASGATPPAGTSPTPAPAPAAGARRRGARAAAFAPEDSVTALVGRAHTLEEGDIGAVLEVREGAFYAVDFEGAGEVRWLSEDELAASEADGPGETDDEEGEETPTAARAAARAAADDDGESEDDEESDDEADDEEQDPQAVAAAARAAADRRVRANAARIRTVAGVRAADVSALVAAAREQGAHLERARIVGIQQLPATGGANVAAVIAACVADATCTVDQAAHRVLRAQGATRTQRLGRLAGDEAALAGGNAPRSVTGTREPSAADGKGASAAQQILAAAGAAGVGPSAQSRRGRAQD